MPTVNITRKGQIVIPAELRKKYGLTAPGKAFIIEDGDRLVISPALSDPVKESRGILKPHLPLKEAQAEYKKEELLLEDN